MTCILPSALIIPVTFTFGMISVRNSRTQTEILVSPLAAIFWQRDYLMDHLSSCGMSRAERIWRAIRDEDSMQRQHSINVSLQPQANVKLTCWTRKMAKFSKQLPVQHSVTPVSA